MVKLVSLTLVLWIGLTASTIAQVTRHLSGKVLNSVSQKALPFASIGLKNHASGTVSNLSGEFDFHIPDAYTRDTLVISMLGYRNLYLPLDRFDFESSSAKVFQLLPREEILDEVTIRGNLSPKDIIVSALSNIKKNYRAGPYRLEGFYREVSMENGKYTALLEAAVNIFGNKRQKEDKKKKDVVREKVSIKAIRKSFNYQKYHDKSDKGVNFLSLLLLENMVNYPENKGGFGAFEALLTLPEALRYELEPMQYYNDKKVFVIRASPKKLAINREQHHFRLFIDVQDMAFLRIDLYGKAEERILHEDPFSQRAALQLLYVNNTLNFKKYKEQYYLSYLKANWGFQAVDRRTKRILDVFEYKKELLINNVVPQRPFVPYSRKRLMNQQKKLDLHVRKRYDDDFWENYNVIKTHPVDVKIIEDLEKEYPLDSQFDIVPKRH